MALRPLPRPSGVDRLTQQSTQFMAVVAVYTPGVRPDVTELDTARVQGLALRSSFQFYQELMAQLARRYRLVEPR